MGKSRKVRNKFNDILIWLISIIILVVPIIISMIMSKVSIIKIVFIGCIIYIIGYAIKKIINKKLTLEPTFNQQYYRDIPQIKPAILLYCLKGNQYDVRNDFYATILDLINRNFFELNKNLDNSSYTIKINKEKDLSELNKFEKNIVELLFLNFNITEMQFSDLKRSIEEDNLFQERIDAWKMLVELEARENQYDIKNNKIIMLKRICAILAVISSVMSYILLVFEGNVSEFIYIATIGIFIISNQMYQIKERIFTQKVIDEMEKGKALKRYLEEYSLINEKQFEQITIWEGFLVYATILENDSKVKEYFDKIFK